MPVHSQRQHAQGIKNNAYSAVDRSIGKSLRKHRMAAQFTQQALAERCGLSFQQIQKYESGKNRIAASRLVQFASALNVPVTSFFRNDAHHADPSSDKTLTTRLLSAALHLEEEPLSHLVGIAEQMTNHTRRDA